jgi:nitroimidazol reductase NimA-like FMN-containing flavoprotein (pyridoxamine 5'-phosphate oxidase superfamily)
MPVSEAWKLLEQCKWADVAFNAGPDGFPYCVSISPVVLDGCVYFHCASEGYKLELLERDDKVCIHAVGRAFVSGSGFSLMYESVVAQGQAYVIGNEALKREVLRKTCSKYAPQQPPVAVDAYMDRFFSSVTVVGITIVSISGKRTIPSKSSDA